MDVERAARERAARVAERNRRRAAQGKPVWEPSQDSFLAREAAALTWLDESEPTVVLPPPGSGRAAEAAGAPARGLARATVVFSLATAFSRVLGLVRQVVAANDFGAAGKINAFTVAYQFPNLVRALVADAALSSAFVPVFSELIERGERLRAWRVASSLFWLMLLGLTALTALFILLAPHLIGIFGNPGGDRSLAVGLSQVLFPMVALLGISGVVVGILNTYDHFTVPALSPVVWNLAIIAGLLIGVPQAHAENAKLYVYAAAILIATAIQVFLPFPWLRGLERGEERLRIVLDWRDPMVRRTFALMAPVTLGLGLINVNAFIDTFFASRLISGTLAPTAIQSAFLVYMLPQGMFSVAIATVLFPTLSRLAARGELDTFSATVGRGLRQIAFLLLPAAAASAVLADPIIRLLYQRGAWHPYETPVVGACLAAFALGLFFNGAMLLLNRAFFSLQSNWVPTAIALGNLFLNALLDLAFYRFGTWGIPLSTSVVNIAGTWALVVALRRRTGGVGGAETLLATVRIAIAAGALAAVAAVVWHPLDAALGRAFPAQVVSLGLALAAGTAAFLAAARVLRVRELELIGHALRRLAPGA